MSMKLGIKSRYMSLIWFMFCVNMLDARYTFIALYVSHFAFAQHCKTYRNGNEAMNG